jgi:fatty aldehyde decarbonylase
MTSDAAPRSEYYRQVLSFVISNAWKGETMAIENYSEMVPMLKDVDAKIATVKQAREEAKHVIMLERLADAVGVTIDPTMVEDEWVKVRESFHEAAQKGDLAACLMIQDLMVESLAVGIYSTFANKDNRDEDTRRVAELLLADEVEHLDLGLSRIKALSDANPEDVEDSLVWAHNRVMPYLFHMVGYACDFLCERKGVPCESEKAFVQNGSLHLDGERGDTSYIDLNRLKAASLEHYISMLDRAAFSQRTVNQLIAGMAAYEVAGKETGVREIVASMAS